MLCSVKAHLNIQDNAGRFVFVIQSFIQIFITRAHYPLLRIVTGVFKGIKIMISLNRELERILAAFGKNKQINILSTGCPKIP